MKWSNYLIVAYLVTDTPKSSTKGGGGGGVREGETKWGNRERERGGGETDRQTDRQADRQAGRQTGRQTD